MKRTDILTSARLSGLVRRYHSWPVLTQQSVAEHTWQTLRIYWQLFGAPPPAITTYLLWHDCGELVTGDPPFPIKANNPDLKAKLDAMEEEALRGMGVTLPILHPTDKLRIKICDLIEMNEHGIHEYKLGNQYAEPIINDTRDKIRELGEKLGKVSLEDQRMLQQYFEQTQGVGLWLSL
jgi:hypothetical protein